MSDRAGYAARQTALLDSLMRADGCPDDFDKAAVEQAGSSLRRKRARAVGHAWPALGAALGAGFDERFDAFARELGPPAGGDGLADGLAFAGWLGPDGPATSAEPVLVELVLARALLRPGHRGALPSRRRGVFVGWQLLSQPHRMLVVVRAPWVGRRWISLAALPQRRWG